METRKFEPTDQNSNLPERSKPWIFLRKGTWILVPELSHLRQAKRQSPPTFYSLPLTTVCYSLLNFVKTQRCNLLRVLDKYTVDCPYRYVVRGSRDCLVKIKKGKFTSKCRWKVAHLWPVICDMHAHHIMHLSMENHTPPPGETWGIRQLKGKKEEKAPPYASTKGLDFSRFVNIP